MKKLTKRVSIYLNSNVTQAFDRVKAHCDHDARTLTSRIVSSAILFLDEQSSSGLMGTPRGAHPIPPHAPGEECDLCLPRIEKWTLSPVT